MKHPIHSLLCLLGTSFFLLAGCTTTGDGAALTAFAAIAQTATSIGVSADLRAHPERRAAYTAAKTALDAFITKDSGDTAAFAAALAKLPLKEFAGPTGDLWIEGAVSIYDLANHTVGQVSTRPAVNKVAVAIRNGLEIGLAHDVRAFPYTVRSHAGAKRIVL